MKKATVLLVVLMVALVYRSFAQEPGIMLSDKPGWHKIGEVKADFKMENESITVLGKDKFKSLLLKVTDAPINIENVQVFYESGEMQELDVKKQLQAGAETQALDIRANEEIQKVVFTYKTLPNRQDEKAHVELYGLKE